MRQIAIVSNPFSSTDRSKQVPEDLMSLLRKKGISYQHFSGEWPSSWNGFTDAWVVGGDGTMNRFINQYPDISIPLSPFKGGSANDFSWMLFGDTTVAEQAARALDGEPTWVDAGDCNGRLFINGAGIGFDGAIVKDLIGKSKQGGKASYLFSVLRHMTYYTEKNCEIRSAEQSLSQECFMISVANGRRYGGGFCVAPEAVANDGKLDVSIVGRISALKRMKYLPVIEKGAHLGLPFVKYFKTGEVEIRSSTVLPAHLDGEFLASDSFQIRCLPKKFLFRL